MKKPTIKPATWRDASGLLGIALVSIGAGLTYPPAGLMVCGTLLIALAVLIARGS